MINDILKDVVGMVVGKHAEGIVDVLKSDKYTNEFLVAKKLGIEVNQVRNILYKLSDYGLVSSTREKDIKKGWYTYFWKFNVYKALVFLDEFLGKRINFIEEQINDRQTKTFYYSKICDMEYTEGQALELDFICPESGDVLEIRDNSKVMGSLRRELNKLMKNKEEVEDGLKKELEKINKKKEKKAKKEAKEKEKKKAEKKAAREKAKKEKKANEEVQKTVKKTAKKTVKKTAKKSTKKKTVKKTTSKKKAIKKNKEKVSG